MYDDELNRVSKRINHLVNAGYFNKRKIYLFGVSDNSRQIIKMLRQYALEIIGVIDNDKTKQGSCCSRIPVISINDVTDITDSDNVFVIYSAYWREMIGQLVKKNIKKSNIFILYKKKKTVLRYIAEACVGRKIYRYVSKKYASDMVFLCPYTGTGDIYLIGTFWKEYCCRNKINNYSFVVISMACKRVAELCQIENICVLDKKIHAEYMIYSHMLWPEKVKLKILNDCWAQIHTNQIEWFRGYKGLEFAPLFKKYVFDLPDSAKPQHPIFENKDSEIKKIMDENGLVSGNTIVLSPYSNTLADLPDEFWNKLAKKISEQGFFVCTNISNVSELAIEGTVPVFFPLTIAPQFIEKAGYFIGVRSGFCDIVSGANATKVILYDKKNRFYMGSAYEYFNLNDMELCTDAIELQYDGNLEEITNKILSVLKGE